MRNLYIPMLLMAILLAGCSKDFLKSYDNRIIGRWHITGVNTIGLGGDSDHLPFRDGTFIFFEDGTLNYTRAGSEYTGTWDIEKRNYNDGDVQRILKITAVNFNTQQILSQFYDEMIFVSTDHFKATINSGYHSYVTHFRR